MVSNIKQNGINIAFTVAVICLAIWIGFIAKVYFFSKAGNLNKVLISDFANYKVKIQEADTGGVSIQNLNSSSNFTTYDKTPTTSLKSTSYNSHPSLNEGESFIIPTQEIQENPLFKSYYSQLGFFANKEGAEEIIKILALKGMLEEGFTSYIDLKQIKSKAFYLVEIGVFETQELAQKFCDKLKRLQVGCVVTEDN
jgi:cell division septation protein DedD